MYSPKISEELIPALYRWAKAEKIPMTRLVNQILKRELSLKESEEITRNIFERRELCVEKKSKVRN